jgi:amidophosphoribosyltransferase
LLAANHSLEEMRQIVGADSLAFLSVDGLYRAMGENGRDPANPKYTDHYFTGDYPTALTDLNQDDSQPRQLSLLAEAS